MGPAAHARRLDAMEEFVRDAVEQGAKRETGGKWLGNEGFFFEPTVLSNVPLLSAPMPRASGNRRRPLTKPYQEGEGSQASTGSISKS
jgi:hypothetical protein